MALVAKAQIKQLVGDFNVSTDFYTTIELEVENMIKKAVQRAKLNQRRTVMAKDL